MKVIGTGLGRTGTKSLKLALEGTLWKQMFSHDGITQAAQKNKIS